MKEVAYNEYGKEAMEQLPKGAFLTTKRGDETNTMTIGWGSIGIMWGRPVLMVAVRYSRHTYEMIDKAGEFTVSFPLNNQLKKELGICGSKSGKDIDKFEVCGLKAQKAQKLDTPVIEQCDLHYECKVVYKQAMEPSALDLEIDERFYGDNNFHVFYYGEIVASYLNQ